MNEERARTPRWWYIAPYNITQPEFDKISQAPQGTCVVCGEPADGRYARFYVGGTEAGTLKGRLCWRCNLGMARLRDTRGDFTQTSEHFKEVIRARA